MAFILQPWHLLLVILANGVSRWQQMVIQFQNEQIRSLLELKGRKRMLLTNVQRRRLAVKGKALGCRALRELTIVVSCIKVFRPSALPLTASSRHWSSLSKSRFLRSFSSRAEICAF